MIWTLLGFGIGCGFSALAYLIFRKRRIAGTIHITQTDDPSSPYMSLELDDDPQTFIFRRTVLLKINGPRSKHVL